jgi:hypothetical protein
MKMNIKFGKYIKNLLLLSFFLFGVYNSYSQQAKTYDEAIIMGDKLLEQHKFLDAKAYYQIALTFKSKDDYAKTKIDEIIKEMNTGLEREDRYLEVILVADKLFDGNKLDEAKAEYAKAMAIIAGDDYAKEQIDKIDEIQKNNKDKLENFNKFIAQGKKNITDNQYDEAILNFKKAKKIFPDNKLPQNLIGDAKNAKAEYESKLTVYKEEVELAERYIKIKNYVEALIHLKKAIGIFPEDWAVEKEIEKYEPLAASQIEYEKQIEKADELYVNRNYSSAREAYAEASELWPENTYTQDMISRIDEQLKAQMVNLDTNYNKALAAADSLLKLKEYKPARAEYNFALSLKPTEDYPKRKLAEIENIYALEKAKTEARYTSIIKSADSLFEKKEFGLSKQKYALATSIGPEDDYPKNQLAEIEKQEQLLAEQVKIDQEYKKIIVAADALIVEKKYPEAIAKYKEASLVKANETYPDDQIKEIEIVIANAAKQRETDAKYEMQITLARRLFSEENYIDARSNFSAAAQTKPLEKEPKEKIKEIDDILKAKKLQKQLDAKYQSLLANADSLVSINNFPEAILAIEAALVLKPADVYAAAQLEKVKGLKTEYDKEMALKQSFNKAMSEGDGFYAEKKLIEARSAYLKALSLIPNERTATKKLGEINILLERKAAEINKKYQETIVKADNLFDASNLSDAIVQYKIASSLKPEETYPKDKIAETNSLIEEKLRLVKNKFDLAIADADKLYAAKIYDKAISAYQKADKIFPEETYPEEMIKKITDLIETNAIVDVIKVPTVVNSGKTEKIAFEPIRISVRKSNYILVKAKNLSGNSFKIIFGYGSKTGKNGGFVVSVPEGNESNDYIIRVGNQYKWFSDDNNWISVYPENGDIEISLLRISKSD